jgi:hypothetical protein
MAKKRRKKKSPEEIASENQFLKMKMMAQFGGDFEGHEAVSPELENQFLKQIMSFQKQQGNSKTISVYKFIGEPEYNHVNDLSDREVKSQLKKLMSYMKRKRVSLDVLVPTPDRVLYRFITEELFKHEIEDIRVKGWVTHFIYEEFHPNVEYDVKQTVHYGLLYLFDKETQLFNEYFCEDMKDHLGLSIELEEIDEKIQLFKEDFYKVMLVNYDITRISINKDANQAHVICSVTYKTQSAPRKRSKKEVTQVEMKLRVAPDIKGWWMIEQLQWQYG